MAKPWLVKVRALFVFLQNVSYKKRMPRFETPSFWTFITSLGLLYLLALAILLGLFALHF